MSLRDLSDYRSYDATNPSFPQPNVPASGNYTGTFGRERQYYGNTSGSTGDAATEDAAEGEKTYSSGKYVFDPKTGKYTWIPTKATTADTTTKKDTVADVVEGAGGGQDRGDGGTGMGGGFTGATNINGVSGTTTGVASLANSLAATLGNLGLTSLSDAIAKGVDPNFSHEGRQNDTDKSGMVDLGSFNIGPTGLTAINAPTAAESQARADAVQYGSPTLGSGILGGDKSGGAFAGTTSTADADNAALADAMANAVSGADASTADADNAALADAMANAVSAADASTADASTADASTADAGGGGTGSGDGNSGGEAGGGFGAQANGGMVGRYAQGGLGSLGGYSDGGRLLRGPGDGVSDSIPATIGRAKKPARLADGEFVVPSRIVSVLGNGSTEAGARKLYAMLARIQAGRKKSIGKNKVAVNSRMDKHLPA